MHSSLQARSGFCVHLGFGQAALTMELSAGGRYLVHGLSADAELVRQGRTQIAERGLGGAVSLEHDPLWRLPYADNLVNLVVAEDLSASPDLGDLLQEIRRVLRPGGVAYIAEAAAGKLANQLAAAGIEPTEQITLETRPWRVFRKPRPAGMDEWTHRRYDGTRNTASRDLVDVPAGLRWLAGPNFPTGHRKQALANKVVSADRLVYAFDDVMDTDNGPLRQKTLIARDAFNGLLLWKRTMSNSKSELIHAGDRVYTFVEDDGPLVALDAKTGEVVLEYPDSAHTEEVYLADGRLVLRLRSGVHCRRAETGELLWEHQGAVAEVVLGDGRVYVQGRFRSPDGERLSGISAFDLATGRHLWHGDSEKWPARTRDGDLLCYQGGVLFFSGGGNHAISAQDGAHLWSYEYPVIGHGGSHSKVVYLDGLLWVHNAKSRGDDGQQSYAWEGLEPHTGKLKKRIPHGTFKHRCNWDAATDKFFLCGSMDFVELGSQLHTSFGAARAGCSAGGLMPANGLVYTFPHGCGCYPMLRGILALSSDPPRGKEASPERHQKGPAWPAAPQSSAWQQSEWPMHRSNPQRTGSTTQAIPAKLAVLWSRQLRDIRQSAMRQQWDMLDRPRLTSVVAAGGLVAVAVNDTHEIFALDADTGEVRWTYTAGGRIDCAPSFYGGLCLFGSSDGYVYCLRADDGQLVWRYRAAPRERRIVAYGQLESAWPVVGGVLVYNDLAYFVAGRHGAADGGVNVYAAQPATGEIVWHSNPVDYNTVPDLLVAFGDHVRMADWEFDPATGDHRRRDADTPLRSSKLGLLNDAWYERPLALRVQAWHAHDRSAQLLAMDAASIYGFAAMDQFSKDRGEISGQAHLFRQPLTTESGSWDVTLPLGSQVRALSLSGERLLVAGRLDGHQEASVALRVLSATSGKTLSEIPLADVPCHDGLSIANRRVYLATESGGIICLGER